MRPVSIKCVSFALAASIFNINPRRLQRLALFPQKLAQRSDFFSIVYKAFSVVNSLSFGASPACQCHVFLNDQLKSRRDGTTVTYKIILAVAANPFFLFKMGEFQLPFLKHRLDVHNDGVRKSEFGSCNNKRLGKK